MERLHVALLVAVLTQAAGQEGTVTGTMTFNGVVVPIRHVYASAQPGFFNKAVDDVHVLLSDTPLTDDARGDVFELIKLARDEKAHIFEVVINAEGTPISGSIYVPEVDGMISASGMHVFVREQLERKTIAGHLSVDEPHTFMKLTWRYDARFSAPIPRPPTAAELAATLASPPAVAATRHLAAIRAGQLPGFLDTLTTEAAAEYQGPGGAAALRQFAAEVPRDSRVVDLVPQTNGTVLAKVEGHEKGVVIGHTFVMVLNGGVWRVGK